jgi:hypothetical protein
MGQVGSGKAGVVVAAVGSGQLEIIVLAAAVALAVLLVGLKAWFSRNQRLRKAAGAGYHQRDLARYTTRGVGETDETAGNRRDRPLAPSFAAPGRHHGSRGAEPPAPAARSQSEGSRFGTFDPATNLVPAFDSETAQRLRPPAPLPSAVVDPPPSAPEAGPSETWAAASGVEEEIPPPDGALPLLQQPPPSPPSEQERHSSAS